MAVVRQNEENAFGPLHAFREPIIYISTKFCENILIRGRDTSPKHYYVVCLVHGRRLQNSVFKGNVFRSFYTLREPITYTPTKFCENTSIRDKDMLPK